jgi:hypothetical protein
MLDLKRACQAKGKASPGLRGKHSDHPTDAGYDFSELKDMIAWRDQNR